MPKANVPRNSRTRAERIDEWNRATEAGRAFIPRQATGRSARYLWLRSIVQSDLPATTRLVAHTLALHGKTDGTGIFPGIRLLATEASLSARAVCDHIELLVRRGRLWRRARGGDTAGAAGFTYILSIPERPNVLNEVQHTQHGTALNEAQHAESVLNVAQHRVERHAERVERRSKRC